MDSQPLNPTAASLLGLLDQTGPLTGGDLVRAAQLRVGEFWTLTRSQVYRELAVLERGGLVARAEAGPRAARPYGVTGAGRQAFRAWLAQPLPAESVRIPLLLAVAFGSALERGRLAELLDAAEAEHRARLAEYEHLAVELRAQDVDAHVQATLAFGLHYERAVLGWLEELDPAVRGG